MTTTTTRLDNVRALVPPKPQIQDFIGMLGGRPQLTVQVLHNALGPYFQAHNVVISGNDVLVKVPLTADAAAKGASSAYFSGAKSAVIDDCKFSYVVRSPACTAGITVLREDGTELMARAIHDVDGLVAALNEFWPAV